MANTMTAIRNHITAQITERAVSDTAFRALLKSDPHAALREMVGADPVPGFKINVIEERAGEINIVLPANIEKDELPDELLDLASGGIGFSAFVLYGPNDAPPKPRR
ncbi:NHLP leader peptide family natural product precursor (plasmid) [Shinella sp. H4-D48]|uniref:NHLP leader peptide family natural product precursor n=1 Tax=Shinella sp. H4-D48 TaxID=2925841 RepID=UPI001F52D5BB|nr:NHLP leader peptide family natural product precursor [Shinella sp. H4-D48]UNK39977.1 NHLP leader peptide family natural product precursor [Shinella sp. H4-D48]